MKDILFIGPVDMGFGPGIKNTYTLDYLKKEYNVEVLNTYHRSKIDNIKNLLKYIFSKKESVISVSSGGRALLLPLSYFKKKIFKKFSYSLISINGRLIEEFSIDGKIKKKLFFSGVKNATKIFVEIQGLKKRLNNEFDIKNVFWFPNFKPDSDYVDFSSTKNSMSFSAEDCLKCAFLARVNISKGIDLAIQAVDALKECNKNISLDIYGPVDDDAKKLIESLSTNENIDYKGVLPNTEVTKHLKDYNLFLFPTRHKAEGFPASILDAYSASLPIISTGISYNKELVIEKENGLICLDSVSSLKDCIEYFMDNPSEIKTMGIKSFELGQKFTTSKVFAKFMSDFKKITE